MAVTRKDGAVMLLRIGMWRQLACARWAKRMGLRV